MQNNRQIANSSSIATNLTAKRYITATGPATCTLSTTQFTHIHRGYNTHMHSTMESAEHTNTTMQRLTLFLMLTSALASNNILTTPQ